MKNFGEIKRIGLFLFFSIFTLGGFYFSQAEGKEWGTGQLIAELNQSAEIRERAIPPLEFARYLEPALHNIRQTIASLPAIHAKNKKVIALLSAQIQANLETFISPPETPIPFKEINPQTPSSFWRTANP